MGFNHLVVPAGRLLGLLGRSGSQQQPPQADTAPTPAHSTPQQRDTPYGDVASHQGGAAVPEVDSDPSSSQQAATPQAHIAPSLQSPVAQQAAASAAATTDASSDADSPVLSSQQGVSPHAPEEPTLQSSLGQHAAQQATPTGSSSVHEDTQSSDAGTQQQQPASGGEAAGSEGVDGGQPRERSCREQAGVAETPQEPALHSGLARRAASMEDGKCLLTPLGVSAITGVYLTHLVQSLHLLQLDRVL